MISRTFAAMSLVYRPWQVRLLGAVGLLLFVIVAVLQQYALRSVITLTDARRGLREMVVGALDAQVALLDMVRVHESFLLTDEVPRRVADYQAAEQRFARRLGVLQARLAAVPDIAPQTLFLAHFLRSGQQRIAGSQAQAAAGSNWPQTRDELRATRQYATEARAHFDGLTGELYRRIDDYDRRVRAWQRHADRAGLALTTSGLIMLFSAYWLLSVEQARRRLAEAALMASHGHLEQAVRQRTAELEASHAQLRVMTRRIRDSVEAERKRLARDVHDQLGQVLTALKMHIHSRRVSDPSLAEGLSLLDEAIHVSRRIAADLRPPLLDDLGLGAALKQLAQQAGVIAQVRVENDEALASNQAVELFRIAQEAVTNVLRHAGAERLRIEGGAADEHYRLVIEDDGVGFDPATVRREALGLLGMRERAYLAGGECRWLRPRYGGTRVEIRLPLVNAEAADALAAGR